MDLAKKKEQRFNYHFIIYLIFVVLVFFLFTIYRHSSNSNVPFPVVVKSIKVSPSPVPTLLPIPDYGSVDAWKSFTNTIYGYSMRYPNLSSYEANSTENSPTAQSNQFVSFISDSYQNGEILFPWKIDINADANLVIYDNTLPSDFKGLTTADIERMNKAYNYGLEIVKEDTIDNHRALFISNNASDSAKLILYANIQKDANS